MVPLAVRSRDPLVYWNDSPGLSNGWWPTKGVHFREPKDWLPKVRVKFVDLVDHHNMNVDVPFLRGIIPTAENIVVACWKAIEPNVGEGRLTRLRLYETENNYVEYDGR